MHKNSDYGKSQIFYGAIIFSYTKSLVSNSFAHYECHIFFNFLENFPYTKADNTSKDK